MEDSPDRKIRLPLLFGAYAGAALLTRAIVLFVPIVDVDEASYLVAARELLRGKLLYVAVADHKPPLVYLYYTAAQLLGSGMLGVRLLTDLVTLPLTALALSAFYRHSRAGIMAGALYLIYGAAFVGHDMLSVNCEVLLLLPAAWALAVVRDEAAALRPSRQLGAGLLLAVAVLFKHQAAAWLPAVMFAAWAARQQARPVRLVLPLAALLAGFAAPLLGVWLWFASRGAAWPFLYWNLTHNLRYAANPIRAREVGRGLLMNLAPFLLVTAALWWAAWRSRPRLSSYQATLVAGVLVLSLATTFVGLRFYPHYFILVYPPLALLAAPHAVRALDERPLAAATRWAAAWTIGLLLAFTLANGIIYARTDIQEETRPVLPHVAARLRADPCYPGATLFTWGYAPAFNALADLPLATRFLFLESTLVGYVPGNTDSARGVVDARSRIRPEHWEWLLADLQGRPPTFIIDTAPARMHRWDHFPLESYPRLWSLVERGYDLADTVDDVRIYRRRGCAGPAHDPGGRPDRRTGP